MNLHLYLLLYVNICENSESHAYNPKHVHFAVC